MHNNLKSVSAKQKIMKSENLLFLSFVFTIYLAVTFLRETVTNILMCK